jgi:magnesium-transporting ATPase (P-type)
MVAAAWYQKTSEEALQELGTGPAGLHEKAAADKLESYGPNRLPEAKRVSRVVILLRQFASPLIYILLIAAAVTFALAEYKDTIVIAAVLLFNAIIGFIQESRAEESVRALQKMIVPQARVVREGREREISSEGLVPGDIVLLASGAKVPADIRLVSAIEMRIDESLLTGESVPAEKFADAIPEANLTPGDQRNIAFMGTVVVNGRGTGVVVETGARTVLGGIAHEIRETKAARAPLQEKFARFSNRIGLYVLAAASALFAVGIAVGEPVREMFMTVVAAAVATIPEGLPVVLTIALAVGVQRMAARNAILRKLPAVETLGSTTVICTDKTGTLTKNEMTVKVVFDGARHFELTGTGYEPRGEILHDWIPKPEAEREHLAMCFRVGLLCNESSLYEDEGVWRVNGDPTEGALIVSALKAGLQHEEERQRYPQIGIIPFESDRGYMATLHRCGDEKYIFIKGAPEKVLELCVTCMELDGLRTEEILKISDRFASEGMRVLAMAYKRAPDDLSELRHEDVQHDLTLAGIQAMIDPPREEAVEAVRDCRRAGIRVIMITGDHPTTALAIARMVGIDTTGDRVITGREIEEMADEDLFYRVKTVSVYARVAPHHKLRIVRQLMDHGEVVAVTGDGVNDAPALRAAHLGVAMGRKGTDVAKEASDMVVTDDNFAAIFHAVREGRVVFENIRKVVFFLIPTGVAAIGSILGCVLMGIPIPYTASQLLWINLVTNGFQVIALTFEPGDREVVQRPPLDPSEGIMSRVLVQRTVIVGLLISAGVVIKFAYSLQAGMSLEKARTIAMTTMVFFQFFQAWNSRSETKSIFQIGVFTNPYLAYGLAASVMAHIAAIYAPPFQWLLSTEPVAGFEWLLIVAMSLSVIVVVEFDKWMRSGAKPTRRMERRNAS